LVVYPCTTLPFSGPVAVAQFAKFQVDLHFVVLYVYTRAFTLFIGYSPGTGLSLKPSLKTQNLIVSEPSPIS
jgi:hypothetical protein